jgi:hypothetical protein
MDSQFLDQVEIRKALLSAVARRLQADEAIPMLLAKGGLCG